MKIDIPDGMYKACLKHCDSEVTLAYILEAALRWQAEDWGKSPNTVRMPDPWYSTSLAKWEKFRSKWNRDGDISFVDLLNFFGNRMMERFLAEQEEIEYDLDPEKARFRVALEKLAKLGNGDSYGNSKGNEIAQEALGIDKHIPVPPQEKDFYHPDPIIETLNKRMAVYADWVHKNLQNLFDKKPLAPRLDWDKPGRKVFTYGDRMKK